MPGGGLSGGLVLRRDPGHRLTMELYLACGYQWFIVENRAGVVFSRYIVRGQHRHHAGLAACRFHVDVQDARVRMRRLHRIKTETPGRRVAALR